MKVLHKDPREGEARLAPETLDDLWHLYHLVEAGDHVTASTTRTQEQTEEKLRSQKAPKVRVRLTVKVEEVEFAAFSDRLRVRGPIIGGAQDVGSYHTLTFEADPKQDVLIRKIGGFRRHHWQRIDKAQAQAKRPLVTILSIDDDEAALAVLRQYGIQHAATIKGRTGGKQYKSDASAADEYFGEIWDAVQRVRPDGGPLVIVGPGFTRENFMKWVKDRQPDALAGALTEGTGQSGMVGVQEALKRGIIERIQQDQEVARDTVLVEQVFSRIAQDGNVGYGAAEVDACLNAGAVELLLVTDERMRTKPGERLLELAQQTGAETHVVSTAHEAGEKLERLGGYAALLRFKPG